MRILRNAVLFKRVLWSYKCFGRYQTNTTIAMFDTMLSIQPKESGGGAGESRESVVTKLSKDMLSKLPKNYNPFEVKDRLAERF